MGWDGTEKYVPLTSLEINTVITHIFLKEFIPKNRDGGKNILSSVK